MPPMPEPVSLSPPSAAARGARWKLATADVAGLSARLLDDGARLEEGLDHGLGLLGESMSFRVHQFAPRGLSLIGTASCARVVLHTWPEQGALTIDLYGIVQDPESILAACVAAIIGPCAP